MPSGASVLGHDGDEVAPHGSRASIFERIDRCSRAAAALDPRCVCLGGRPREVRLVREQHCSKKKKIPNASDQVRTPRLIIPAIPNKSGNIAELSIPKCVRQKESMSAAARLPCRATDHIALSTLH